jgi:hypothetical protein
MAAFFLAISLYAGVGCFLAGIDSANDFWVAWPWRICYRAGEWLRYLLGLPL